MYYEMNQDERDVRENPVRVTDGSTPEGMEGFKSNQAVLRCPVCGEEKNSPCSVSINRGGDVIIFAGTQKQIRYDAEPDRRGTSVLEQFVCGNGHIWEFRISHYKGETRLSAWFVRELEMDHNGKPLDAPEEMWTD